MLVAGCVNIKRPGSNSVNVVGPNESMLTVAPGLTIKQEPLIKYKHLVLWLMVEHYLAFG